MATKDDFTEDEWSQLQRGMLGAALLVSVSDPGFFETFKEAGAAGRHLAEARQNNQSELVRELAASPPMGFGFGMRPEDVEPEVLGALRAAGSTLRSKAPGEFAAYQQFVEAVAQSVAAASEGVVPSETATIEKITSALAPAEGE